METYLLDNKGTTNIGISAIEEIKRVAKITHGVLLYEETIEKELTTLVSSCGFVRAVTFKNHSDSVVYVKGVSKSLCCNSETLFFNDGKMKCSNCLTILNTEVV